MQLLDANLLERCLRFEFQLEINRTIMRFGKPFQTNKKIGFERKQGNLLGGLEAIVGSPVSLAQNS